MKASNALIRRRLAACVTVALFSAMPTMSSASVELDDASRASDSSSTPPLAVNDRIVVSDGPLQVRSTPSTEGDLVGAKATRSTGTIVDGPTEAEGHVWWNVNFATGADGWVIADHLKKSRRVRTTSGSGIPSPESIAGKPIVNGPISAKSGQIIENVHVVSSNGDCIVIQHDVRDVTIRNSEIGPCTLRDKKSARGVFAADRSTNITIDHNVFHDVSTGAFFYKSLHPIRFDHNYIYDIHGPFPQGNMIQFHSVVSGTEGSRILCNISDQQGSRRLEVGDHVSMFLSLGLPSDRTEIAYNRLRGGSNKSGSAIQAADGGGGNVWVHDNTVVNVGGAGIALSSGQNVTIENNRIYSDGVATLSGAGLHVRNDYPGKTVCDGNVVTHNRISAMNSAWHSKPVREPVYVLPGSCTNTAVSENAEGSDSMSPAIFDEEYPQCR